MEVRCRMTDLKVKCSACGHMEKVDGEAFEKWLAEHDREVTNNAIDEVISQMKNIQFQTGRAWFDFDAGIDRCVEIANKMKKVGGVNE